MRILIIALVFASALAAQRGGGRAHFRGSAGHGFMRGGFVQRPGGFGHFGGYRGGYHRGFNRGYHRGFAGGGLRVGIGGFYGRGGSYAYGGWYGSPFWSMPVSYSPPYDYAYPNSTAPIVVTFVTAPLALETSRPTIVINDERARERAETEPRPTAALATRSPLYLIAANDGIIWAALAYWMEEGTLHFVNSKSERKQIPLAQVDRTLTEQLNRERRVAFRLP